VPIINEDLCNLSEEEFTHQSLVGRTVIKAMQQLSFAVQTGRNAEHPAGSSLPLDTPDPDESFDVSYALYRDACHTTAYRKIYSHNVSYCLDHPITQQAAPSPEFFQDLQKLSCTGVPGVAPDSTWLVDGRPVGMRDGGILWATFGALFGGVCGNTEMNDRQLADAVWKNFEIVFDVTPAEMSEVTNSMRSDCARIPR
jgi:hypothetical protein